MATNAIADGDDWERAGDVIASQYRTAVLKRLAGSPAIPSKIAAQTGVDISHVSRALSQLREDDLVELLVAEERRKGRVYGITEEGADVWNVAQEAVSDE